MDKPRLRMKSIFGLDDSIPVVGRDDIFGYKQNDQPVVYSNPFGYTEEELARYKKDAEKISDKVAEVVPENLPIRRINHDLEWELIAPHYIDPTHGDHKLPFLYSESLKRIKEINRKDRHPYPVEVFGLAISAIEGSVSENERVVNIDMQRGYGEWLNIAFFLQDCKLFVYSDDGSGWQDKNQKYTVEMIFDIPKVRSETYLELNYFPEQFAIYMYGRKFADLPEIMRKGQHRAKIYIPRQRTLSAIVFEKYSLISSSFWGKAASRGVHECQRDSI